MGKLYYEMSKGLLTIEEVKERAKKFKSIRILDRDNYYVIIFNKNSNGNIYLPCIINK